MKIVHITPHLGGGVGKALSCLIKRAMEVGLVDHVVLCLEEPQKRQAVDAIVATGCRVMIQPSMAEVQTAIADADVVQLEFWNHPEIPRLLCALESVPMRLLVWCHISGLYNPQIPPGLFATDASIVFTSSCSLEHSVVQQSGKAFPVVSSGCVDGLPVWRERAMTTRLRVGYVGTWGFTKLHPDFVSFLTTLPDEVLPVHLYGDTANQGSLEAQCVTLGCAGLLHFHEYVADISSVLTDLDVLAYLLNPRHYGTAENALIEAMAMGVVPVVLDNPAECAIVVHGQTGYIVHDQNEFTAALCSLMADPQGRRAIARRAVDVVRKRFTEERMERELTVQYHALMSQKKTIYRFQEIFGNTPGAWFDSFQPADLSGHAQWRPIEYSKGSVHHFLAKFPDDPHLQMIAAIRKPGFLAAEDSQFCGAPI